MSRTLAFFNQKISSKSDEEEYSLEDEQEEEEPVKKKHCRREVTMTNAHETIMPDNEWYEEDGFVVNIDNEIAQRDKIAIGEDHKVEISSSNIISGKRIRRSVQLKSCWEDAEVHDDFDESDYEAFDNLTSDEDEDDFDEADGFLCESSSDEEYL